MRMIKYLMTSIAVMFLIAGAAASIVEYSGTATSNGTVAGSPASLFDNSASTGWQGSNGAYIKVDFGAGTEKQINSLGVQAHASYLTRAPREFVLMGSNDDSSYTTLLMVDHMTTPAARYSTSATYLYNFTNNLAYRYYMFVPYYSEINGRGYSSGQIWFSELDLRYDNDAARNIPNFYMSTNATSAYDDSILTYTQSKSAFPGDLIQFNGIAVNATEPITDWYWDFGDGTFSYDQSPKKSYSDYGTYDVYLITTVGGVPSTPIRQKINIVNTFRDPVFPFGYPFSATASMSTTPAANAHNKNPADFWQANSDADHWIKYDYGAPRDVNGFSISHHTTWFDYTPRAFIIEGSNDNTNWDIIYDKYGDRNTNIVPYPVASTTVFYNFSQTYSYRYYRFTPKYVIRTANEGNTNAQLIPELEYTLSDPKIMKADFVFEGSTTSHAETASTLEQRTLLVGGSYLLNSTTISQTPVTSYSWDVNNDGTPESTSSSYLWTPTTPGTYYVTLTVSDGSVTKAKTIRAEVVKEFEWLYGDSTNVATASATTGGSARKLFDQWYSSDAAAESWYADAPYPYQWVQMNYERPVLINSYEMQMSSAFVDRAPREFVLMGSHDGTVWIEIDNKTSTQSRAVPRYYGGLSGRYWYSGYCENTVPYQYYRMRVDSTLVMDNIARTMITNLRLKYTPPTYSLNADVFVQGDGYYGVDTFQMRNYDNQTFTVMRGKQFTLADNSFGSPTTWQWDINGDGIAEAYTKNFTTSVNTKGIYQGSLTVGKPGGYTSKKYFVLNVVDAVEPYYRLYDTGGAATASGTTGGAAYKVFDGTNSDAAAESWYVAGLGYPGSWVTVKYGREEAHIINEVTIRATAAHLNDMPRQMIVQASNDGTSFTTLDSRLIDQKRLMRMPQAGSTIFYQYNFTNSNPYKYYRLVFTSATPTKGTYRFMVSEIAWKYHDPSDFLDPAIYIESDGIVGEPSHWDYYGDRITSSTDYSIYNDTLTAMTNRQVQFKDGSIGDPTGWSWDFGDGSTSTLQNPTHTFATAGNYLVTLSITKGSNTQTKVVKVIVRDTYEYPVIPVTLNSGSAVPWGVSASGTNSGNVAFLFDETYAPETGDGWYELQATGGTGLAPWIKIDFGNQNESTKRVVNEFCAYPGTTYPNYYARAYRMEASNDNINWVILDDRTENPTRIDDRHPGSGCVWRTFDNAEPYRYYRYVMLSSGINHIVSELKLRYHDPSTTIINDFYANRSWVSDTDMTKYPTSRTVFRDETIQFIDESVNGVSYSWDFNGDGVVDSTSKNGTYVYSTNGEYTVTHTVSNGAKSVSKVMKVTVADAIEPAYGLNLGGISTGLYSITADTYYSTYYPYLAANHVPGTGNVNGWYVATAPPHYLIYDYGGGKTNISSLSGWEAPVIDRYQLWMTSSSGNLVQMPRSWELLGSNDASSWVKLDEQTTVPEWSVSETRTYNVTTNKGAYRYLKFNVLATGGSTVHVPELNFFMVSGDISDPPVASFTMSREAGDFYAKQVSFVDTSYPPATSRIWDFGDNTTSTEQYPSHWYSVAGNYTVTLTATNSGGSDQATKYFVLDSDWDNQVKSWAQFNGAPGSSEIIDRSGFTWNVTGNSQISATTNVGFGNGSLILDGASDIYTYADGMNPGGKNFTMELWFKRGDSSAAVQVLASKSDLGSSGYALFLASNKLTFKAFQSPSTVVTLSEPGTTTDTDWHFVTVQRAGNEWALHKDGVPVSTSSWSNAVTSNELPVRIGNSEGALNYFVGNVDCFRYSDNVARWEPSESYDVPYNEYMSTSQTFMDFVPTSRFGIDHPVLAAGSNVTILDQSENTPTDWIYQWGDGSENSTDQHPTHTFVVGGQVDLKKNYTITQTVSNTMGADSSSQEVTVYKFSPSNQSVNFVANLTEVYNDDPIKFTDLSMAGPITWAWDFDDDGTIDSTVQSPVFAYATAGVKSVNLTITTDVYGANTTTVKSGYITVTQKVDTPISEFTATPRIITPGATVTFTDLSLNAPTTWAWDFDDDGTIDSTTKNPSFQFVTAGNYTVNLTTSNAFGSNITIKVNYIEVGDGPIASFHGSPTSGAVPLAVQFTSTSSGATGWKWDFENDGNIDSVLQNPLFTYNAPGTYSVRLNATNYYGFNITTKTNYISSGNAPVADFTQNVTSGVNPVTIQFTDTSTASPTTWAWDFGDGGNSFTQHPIHTYTTNGTKSVTLTVANTYGNSTTTKSGLITISDPPPPVSNFTVDDTTVLIGSAIQFTDFSTNNPYSWAWDFGDGGSSTLQNPSHIYTSAGDYTVSLTTTNDFGSNTLTRTAYVTAAEPAGFNRVDIEMTRSYVVRWILIDSTTGSPITAETARVYVNNGSATQELVATGGSATGSFEMGIVSYYATASDYYASVSKTALISDDKEITIRMTPVSDSLGAGTIYYPHNVRFIVKDLAGQPIEGVTITATSIEASVPWEWLTSFFGINSQVSISNTTLVGTTGTDGSWTTSMVEVVKYEVSFDKPEESIHESITVYPKEDNYVIVVTPVARPSTVTMINGTLTDTSINATHERLALIWEDTSGTTTNLTFIVREGAANNAPIVYAESVVPSGNLTMHYDVARVAGETYVWGFTATNTQFDAPLTKFWFVTFEGDERLVDLHIPEFYYNWITIAMLIGLAGFFGATTRRFGVVFLPLWACFCKYIGWFPAVDWLFLSIALVLGILIYIRAGEREQRL